MSVREMSMAWYRLGRRRNNIYTGPNLESIAFGVEAAVLGLYSLVLRLI